MDRSHEVQARGRAFMPKQKRCPYCRRLYIPDPRRKERQATCGGQGCRRKRKRQSDRAWRSHHQDYFRGIYQQQKEEYGTRAEYKKQYRLRNPEYVRRNAAFAKKCRERRRKAQPEAVSHTSCDLRLSLWKETGSVSITHVSHTSRDILITVSQNAI
jgi:hypothetical protein